MAIHGSNLYLYLKELAIYTHWISKVFGMHDLCYWWYPNFGTKKHMGT